MRIKLSIFLALVILTLSVVYSRAQEIPLDEEIILAKPVLLKFVSNELFNSISIEKEMAGITQSQNDFSMLYGRLDYISNQIKQLQDRKCGR